MAKDSEGERSRPHKAWRRRTFPIDGLGTVEMGSLGIGLVWEAQKQAAKHQSEAAQGEHFFTSLLTVALVRPKLGRDDAEGLSERQREQLSEALASLLGCEAEFQEEADDHPPTVRLYRAQRSQWKKLFAQVREQFVLPKLTASFDFSKLIDITRIAPELSDIVRTLQESRETFKGVAEIVRSISIPSGELFLPALRAGGLDLPILYPPTSIWRTEPPPAEIDSVDPQQQRWAKAYEMVMHVETSLRSLVQNNLSELHGEKWWKRGVPEAIRKECERRKADKEEEGDESHHPLTYSYIDELRAIVLKRDNWRACFQSFFPNAAEAEVWMNKVSEYRQPTMHFRSLDEDAFLFLTAACRWLVLRLPPR